MPRPVDRRESYFPGLDGLRVVAVGLVVAYHVKVPHVDGGLLGVGVFFTLSGYLITSVLLTGWERRKSAGLSRFWIRRARRLLPAVILLLITTMAAALAVHPSQVDKWGAQALAGLFYVANWTTILEGDTYFNRFAGPSPLEHLWSLSVEEQFYIVWPLLLLALLALFRRKYRLVAGVTFLLGLASMIELWVLYSPSTDATRVYEGTDTRAGGLLWGAALALMWRPGHSGAHGSRLKAAGMDVLGVIGLAGIIALSCLTKETSAFIYQGGIALLTICTCMVLAAATYPRTLVARVLGLTPLRWLGERTYGIYLWHMPVAAFLPEHSFYGQTVLRGSIVVVMTVVLAALSWKVVENPIRTWGFRGAWRRGTDVMSGAARNSAVPPFIRGGVVLAALAAAALGGIAHLPQMSVQEIAKREAAKSAAQEPKPQPQGKAPAIAAPEKGKPTRTSCTSVVHIGDSTSLGLSDTDLTAIADPAKRIRSRYLAVGVTHVSEDIKGGRNIYEHYKNDTNGLEAVQEQAEKGFNGCYVIALGMNDAATISTGGTSVTAAQRIDMIMKATHGRPVLWVNTITQAWVSLPEYQNANMQKFNAALLDATKRWPNLRVYDWAAEALPHPEWFFQTDANHNNTLGSEQKALGITRALTVAYPRGRGATPSKVVRSHD